MECTNFTSLFKELANYRQKRLFLASVFLISFSSVHAQNTALNLNGTDGYVSIGSPLTTGSSYTKEAWIYVTKNTSVPNNVISSYNSPLWIDGGYLRAGNNSSLAEVIDPTPIPVNIWVHVAVTFDASTRTLKLYRNGVLVSTATSVKTYTAQNNYIGAWFNGTSTESYLGGRIDEVRMWNVVRSAAEIKLDLLGNTLPNTAGLLTYYKMNEGSGTTVINSSTSAVAVSNNGTLINGITWVASPVEQSNNALSFDGNNDNVSIGAPLPSGASYTKEAWVYVTNPSIPNNVISSQNSPIWTSSGALAAGNNSNIPEVVDPSPLPANTWVHVAVTFDAATKALRLYRNGNLVQSATSTKSYTGGNNYIGAWFNGTSTESYLGGQIDEVRIWNVARTQAQIQANMSTALAGNEPNLVAYYSFNQGLPSGNNAGLITAIDGTANNNNGTLINFSLSGTTSNYVGHLIAASAISPIVTSLSPTSGPTGTTITVNGSGFSPIASQNKVYFGNAPANVTSATATQLVLTLPMAASGRIKIVNTATGLSVQSDKEFITTFPGGIAPGTSIQMQFPKVYTITGPNTTGDSFQSYMGFRTIAGDFDGDGKVDAAVMGSVANNIMIVYQNKVPLGKAITSDGFIEAATLALDANTYTAYSEDVNNDGRPDIILSGSSGFTVFQNTSLGAGDFSFTKLSFPVSATYAGQKSILVDLDNDGLPDIASLNPAASNILSFFKNTSSGGTISFNTTGIDITAPLQIGDLVAADLDNDGDKDLVISSTSISSPQTIYYVQNNNTVAGTISMGSPVVIYNGMPRGNWYGPAALAVSDLDKDGDMDVVSVMKAATTSTQLLYIHKNDGALSFTTFAAGNFINNSNITLSMRTADVNGDGKTDILFGEQNTGNLSAVLNKYTSGTLAASDFADFSRFSTNNIVSGIAVEDFNNDGKVDIMTSSYYTGTINLLGNGNLALLPVRFTSFTAQPENGLVELAWTTASEQNSKYFEVERSANGIIYTTIGTVAAAGNSHVTNNYQFTDAAPLQGNSFYRLKQIDIDGKSMYSTIQKVVIGGADFSYTIVQNPVSSQLKLNIQLPEAKKLKLEVRDARGVLLAHQQQSFSSGNSIYTLPVGNLASGTYFINIITEKGNHVKTFVKQ